MNTNKSWFKDGTIKLAGSWNFEIGPIGIVALLVVVIIVAYMKIFSSLFVSMNRPAQIQETEPTYEETDCAGPADLGFSDIVIPAVRNL